VAKSDYFILHGYTFALQHGFQLPLMRSPNVGYSSAMLKQLHSRAER